MKTLKSQIDYFLIEYLNSLDQENELVIMAHYVLKDGKRLRPILAALCARTFNIELSEIKNYLIAIEILHNYSLVHDDLPALDNDDCRRGELTAHKKFGEANAILLGDALQTMAFELMSQTNGFRSENILKLINLFAQIAGHNGLIYGELLDINLKDAGLEEIRKIHLLKTSKLFGFCAAMGAVLNGENEKTFYEFGIEFGYGFQLLDDIDDFNQGEKGELNICAVMDIQQAQKELDERQNKLKRFILSEIKIEHQKNFLEFINIFAAVLIIWLINSHMLI